MDRISGSKRSRLMATIKRRDTRSTELKLRGALTAGAISGWKYQPKEIPGNPDFTFPRNRIAIFVDGCFWHGCPCCYRRPKSHQSYWDNKVVRNVARDRRVDEQLKGLGWRIVRIWEHELRSLRGCVLHIRKQLFDCDEVRQIARGASHINQNNDVHNANLWAHHTRPAARKRTVLRPQSREVLPPIAQRPQPNFVLPKAMGQVDKTSRHDPLAARRRTQAVQRPRVV
jgi:DNA mismatch endonuclease, patch repair protein